MDKVNDGKENELDIESDTIQILNDIYQVIKYSNKWQNMGVVSTTINPNKFKEKGGSVVNGWYATLGFKVKKPKRGICDLPFINYNYGND